jgi:hypothetical protein
MNRANPMVVRDPQKRPLAACLALALAAAGACTAGDAEATTFTVTNCSDSGAGSLRAIIGAGTTQSGDTVDFSSQLGCSTITLSSGEIVINQSDLTVVGPGASALAIDAAFASRVFNHVGSGALEINELTIKRGQNQHTTGAATGGCIVSSGSVKLYFSTVTSCLANGQGANSTANAYGGGIDTLGNLTLFQSTISNNEAIGPGSRIWGGGAFVAGNLLSTYSTISNNSALSPGQFGSGGGLYTYHNANVAYSTISGNQADSGGGWSATTITNNSASIAIGNSTISGNFASVQSGGMFTSVPLTLDNDTIAFNEAGTSPAGAGLYSTGVALTLNSSIIADNTVSSTGAQSDLGGPPTGTPISGHHNLITSGLAVVFPIGTLSACPKLGPLADNGGGTLTHALAHNSPAIDAGSNLDNDSTDQRGTGFPRLFGASADIGAYEWQGTPDDRLFVSRFESTCDN